MKTQVNMNPALISLEAEDITIKDAGNIITATDAEAALQEVVTNQNSHKNSTAAHNADNIDFTPGTSGISATKAGNAIKEVNARVSTIVAGAGASNTEILDARTSATKGVVYTTLKERLEASEVDIEKTKAPSYSTPVEATAPVVSLPSTALKGQLSTALKGKSRRNLILSSNMDKDSNADGKVDEFTSYTAPSHTVVFSFDSTEKAQKIEITASTGSGNSDVEQTVDVEAGEIISVGVMAKNSGDITIGIHIQWLDASNAIIGNIGTSGVLTSASFANFKLENRTAPANTKKAKILFLAKGDAAGKIGSVWFKNALVEKASSVGQYISSGTKYSLPHRIKSTGKNLFNANQGYKFSPNTVSQPYQNGIKVKNTDAVGYRRVGYLFRVPPSTALKVSYNASEVFGGQTMKCKVIIAEGTIPFSAEVINGVLASSDGIGSKTISFNSSASGLVWIYFHCSYETTVATECVYDNIVLSADGIYEPYTETATYLPSPGRSLPNGVKDEVSLDANGQWQKVQRVKEIALQSIDITSVNPGTLVDRIFITKPADYAYNNIMSSNANNSFDFEGRQMAVYDPIDGWDIASNVGKITASGSVTVIVLLVAKDTYTTLGAAQAALAGKPLTYQLATEIKNQLEGIPQLTAETSGSIIVEPAVKDTATYEVNIAIANTTLPIKTLEKVTKITIAGDNSRVETDIPVSTCTIASDGLSFTSTGLTAGDRVEYNYLYDSALSTLPSIVYSYPLNIKAQVESNVKMISTISKDLAELSDTVIAWLLDIESRLS